MKIYDISQEVLSSTVYPGDPSPKAHRVSSMESGALYNLSEFSMCAHNGTHVDAPLHFINTGKSIDELELSQLVGPAYVAEFCGILSKNEAKDIIAEACKAGKDSVKRILIKGNATVTEDASEAFNEAKILLLGVESQSVGPIDTPMVVHKILLGAGVVLLEGLRLGHVPCGKYLLCAAPLKLSGFEGAPCRAILIKE